MYTTDPSARFITRMPQNAWDAVFEPLMARLSDRFTTIAVDQRGHGRSDKPETGYEANDYADDIAGLIRTLDRGHAILVGHSLGARNSVTVAAKYPDLVRSVIAIDFTPYIETEPLDALEARVNAGSQLFEDVKSVEAYLAGRYPNIPADAIRIRAESGYQPVDGGLRPLASPAAMAQTAKGLRSDLVPAYRDVTKPVVLDAEFAGLETDPWGNARMGFSAATEIEREDWGMTWNIALESGGWLVSKKVKLEIDVEAILPKQDASDD